MAKYLPNARYLIETHGQRSTAHGHIGDQSSTAITMQLAKEQKRVYANQGYDESKITITQLNKRNAKDWWFGHD